MRWSTSLLQKALVESFGSNLGRLAGVRFPGDGCDSAWKYVTIASFQIHHRNRGGSFTATNLCSWNFWELQRWCLSYSPDIKRGFVKAKLRWTLRITYIYKSVPVCVTVLQFWRFSLYVAVYSIRARCAWNERIFIFSHLQLIYFRNH
jgi:hypothetical protein